MNNTYELSVIYGNVKSYYGKAQVIETQERTTLISYTTEVAYIENDMLIVNGVYSNTTTRHIKEFAQQNGFNVASGRKMYEIYKGGTVNV